MTTPFVARTTQLCYGSGVSHQLVKRLTGDREPLVIADSTIVAPWLADLAGQTLTVDASSTNDRVVGTIAREIVRRSPDVIVAVGGGTVLDASKIAALILAPKGMFEYTVGHASASALTILPHASSCVDFVAVPTTLGTSSETNSVAVLKNERGYRLIMGCALRPSHAILDPDNLATLADATVREGALEAFLRLAGASTSPRTCSTGHREAIALGSALLEVVARDSASSVGRLRLARLSAATQRGVVLRGHDPYSARHWYVANEVAFLLGVRKMVATAAVVAAVWRRICSGDARWGDRERLEQFWTTVAGGAGLPLDPPTGIAALLDRWGIPRPPEPTAIDLERIAVATERAWGDRRPMLAGLVAGDFMDLLRDSSWSPQPVDAIADRPNPYERG